MRQLLAVLIITLLLLGTVTVAIAYGPGLVKMANQYFAPLPGHPSNQSRVDIAFVISLNGKALFESSKVGMTTGSILKLDSTVGPNGSNGYSGPVMFNGTVTPGSVAVHVKVPGDLVISPSSGWPNLPITISTDPTTPLGSYTVTVNAIGIRTSTTVKFQLIVSQDTSDFSIVFDKTDVTLPALGWVMLPFHLASHNFQGTVSMRSSTSNTTVLKSNLGGAEPFDYALSWGDSQGFWVNAISSADTPLGTYTVSVTATSGTLTHKITATITVTSKEPNTIHLSTNSNHYTVKIGTSVLFDLMFKQCGFAGWVDLTYAINGNPVGLAPTSYSGGFRTYGNCMEGNSPVGVTAASNAVPGTYVLLIKATSGDVSDTLQVDLTVTN